MSETANQWILDILEPLRDALSTWPAVLPSQVGDPILPLKVGVDRDLAALLGRPPSEARGVVGRALGIYTASRQYRAALGDERSQRHALDGTPVEPVSEGHKARSLRNKEVFVMAVETKALKVTVVLDAKALRAAPPGAPVAIEVKTPGGISARANLNPKSYRKALEAIRTHGPENVAVVLQGRMVKPGEILDAGITVQERKAASQ